jgi:hypothetical protein
MKKTPLKKVSKNKEYWLRLYNDKKETDEIDQHCQVCKRESNKFSLDRHHPRGRSKDLILYYIYVCRECHTYIHEHPNESRNLGLLAISTNGYRNQNT